MSINDVRLVGRLVKDPEFGTTTSKKEFFRLVVETERFVRVSNQRRRIAHQHAVTCFNQFSIGPMREHGRAGAWVKVFGELSGVRDNMPEVTVSQWNGEAALMFADDSLPAARPEATDQKDETTKAKPSGGLGRLSDSSKPSSSKAPPKVKEYDPTDDEIPF